MKRLYISAVLSVLGLFAEAHAVGRLAEVTLIDRDSGNALAAHYYRGQYWVAGTPGARYAIEIHNRLGERLLAVTSVDGVNVVSGATAAFGQTGYVFGAGEAYQITGWRKSDAEVAAFAFTPSPNSYAERTLRPANVGVIGVALFRERTPVIVPEVARPLGEVAPAERSNSASESAAAGESFGSAAPAPRSADSAAKGLSNYSSPGYQVNAPKLGTAHGQREGSWVSHTDFQRMQSEPNEIIQIRYDSTENLVAMGILPRRSRVPAEPNAFPGVASRGYVPDPPG